MSKKKQDVKEEKEELEDETEPGLEESLEESETQIREIGFQNFIQTQSSQQSSNINQVESPLASESLELNLQETITPVEDEKKEDITKYVVRDPTSEREYKEMIQEQARMSSQSSAVQTQRINMQSLGTTQRAIGHDVHFQQVAESINPSRAEYESAKAGNLSFDPMENKGILEDFKKDYEVN